MLPRILLEVICVALPTDGVHVQTTHMSAEEKIKELQQLDIQSKMQEQMTTMQREMEALKAQQQQEREVGRIRLTPDDIAPLRVFLRALNEDYS